MNPDRTEREMSDTHAHDSPSPSPFSQAEWHEFHESDKSAGGAVIILMSGIFGVGLVLYTIIAFIVGA
jgi:hypothetical protein